MVIYGLIVVNVSAQVSFTVNFLECYIKSISSRVLDTKIDRVEYLSLAYTDDAKSLF